MTECSGVQGGGSTMHTAKVIAAAVFYSTVWTARRCRTALPRGQSSRPWSGVRKLWSTEKPRGKSPGAVGIGGGAQRMGPGRNRLAMPGADD